MDPVTLSLAKSYARKQRQRRFPLLGARANSSPEDVVVLSDCEGALPGWSPAPTADTSIFMEGTQSAKISSTNGSVVSTALNISGNSLVGKYVEFWVYVDDSTKLQSMECRIYTAATPDGGPYRGWTLGLATGWNRVRLHIGNDNVGNILTTSSADRLSLARAPGKIWFRVTAKANETVNVYVDNVTLVKSPLARGIVAFCFDDHWGSVPRVAAPLFAKYHIPATFFVGVAHVGNPVGEGEYVTEEELRDLRRQGWVIASHTFTEINLASYEKRKDVRDEIRTAQKWLAERYFSTRVLSYPQGGHNDTVLQETSKYHEAARCVGNFLFSLPAPHEPGGVRELQEYSIWQIPSYHLTNANLASFKNMLDIVAAMRMCITTYTHTIGESVGDITPNNLEEVIQYALDLDLDIVTIDDLLDVNGATIAKHPGWQEVLTGSGTVNSGEIPSGSIATATITVIGAEPGDSVYVGPPAAVEAGLLWSAAVTDYNQVTLRLYNSTASPITPASATWRVRVVH